MLEAVEKERCTALHGVPTMFIAELEHPDFKKFDLTSLRTGVMAGAPCPIELMKRVNDAMHLSEITIGYGETEASPIVTQTLARDTLERRTETVGPAIPHTELKVVDPATGKTVPVGEQGEICARGYQIMRGYYNNEKATKEAVDEAGWLHTGDIGLMREDGAFKITGRIKDMIIRGGENIYPREIEEFLYTNPKIRDAQVIGVPDRKMGEEICVWIQLREGESLDRGGDQGVVQGPDRPLQDPALREVRHGVPDDRHGEDPEVQDARDLDPRARPRGRRRRSRWREVARTLSLRTQSQSLQWVRRESVRALARPSRRASNAFVAEMSAPSGRRLRWRSSRPLLIMASISYDRDRATVRIDPHGPHSEGPIELDVLDFIARLTVHIPEPHERLVLYYGLYSNASRQRRVSSSRHETSACPADHFDGDESEWLKTRRTRWAQLIRKVWQEDPLLCPRCGGTMRIISFITDQTVIDKILRHIGFKHADTPPPRYHPPPQLCRSPLG